MYELKIALRHITARKRHTLFAVLSVALAVGVIVVLMSMMSGFTEELVRVTVESSPHIVVSSQDQDDEYLHFSSYYSGSIEGIDGVEAVSPSLLGQAALSFKDNAVGAALHGVYASSEEQTSHVSKDLTSGSFLDLDRSRHGIVIGDNMAEELDASLGDWVTMVDPLAGSSNFKIIGIVDTGTDADETTAYVRLETLQDYFSKEGVVSSINLRVQDPFQADIIAAAIEKDTGLDAVSWIESNKEILELLNTQTAIVWIYYSLIYFIAGFGIANTLVTIVMEKKREIGMLMAMGIPRKNITLIFIMEAVILGTVGVLLGCIMGYVAALGIGSYRIELPQEVYYGLTTLPIKIDPLNFVYAGVFSFIINVITGAYPARKASSLNPVEAIESE
ncbi:ABC transporter permease [Methanomethylovorans sp.]|uniref:ABC transporter permease n=1 Tax=Methanomethylovorans sp. TaxID=2758717 RepID=UPI00351C7B3D